MKFDSIYYWDKEDVLQLQKIAERIHMVKIRKKKIEKLQNIIKSNKK